MAYEVRVTIYRIRFGLKEPSGAAQGRNKVMQAKFQPRSGALASKGKLDTWRAYMLIDSASFEKHYRIAELAEVWGLGRETVRRLVKDDPGVIKIRMGRKKSHTVYSIPESAARRIHTRLLNPI
jgi:AraC-like DNA-binding protein